MATLESINAKIAKLKVQAESLVAKKSTVVLDKIRGLMEQHGIGVSDIETHVGKRRGRKPGAVAAAKQSASVAKYRDPKLGATWTGHGRAPAWIANAKDRTKFLVDGASPNAAAPAKAAKAAKAGNYVRGPQPALYRDAKSGATWSGRGRAPSWIANAKDRSKFLVAGGAMKSAASVKETSKAGHYVRGPQPTLYRDPKTGATWSGRGRAPAWLASVKDRSTFLIADAAKPAAAPKAKAVKAVAAKKAAAKTATAKKAPAKKAAAEKVAAPARKTAAKLGPTANAPVARKARVPRSATKAAGPVVASVHSAPTEVASTPAAA